jgi:hypothetical protein
MIRCNNCPCFAPPNDGAVICGITGWHLDRKNQYEFVAKEEDCPLKRLELKTGEVYEPEVIDGEV